MILAELYPQASILKQAQ